MITSTRVLTRAADTCGTHAAEPHVARRIEDATGLSFRLPGNWTAPWEVTDSTGRRSDDPPASRADLTAPTVAPWTTGS